MCACLLRDCVNGDVPSCIYVYFHTSLASRWRTECSTPSLFPSGWSVTPSVVTDGRTSTDTRAVSSTHPTSTGSCVPAPHVVTEDPTVAPRGPPVVAAAETARTATTGTAALPCLRFFAGGA